ncbi:hypothetical protein LCGC14_0141070 [marine sediment metagenome]|uniref:Bacteriophage Mu GpT domain-containing protein n=1 Tax=marine sediment metagenome TaxID=412755 RepID=A0A0F9XI75_9ZZZZ
MKRNIVKPTDDQIELLRKTGSNDRDEQKEAMKSLAEALETPLRSALLDGDILGGIFTPELLAPDATPEYPLDLYQTAQEGDYVAYQLPSEGALPLRTVVSDSLTVQTYSVGNAIDWPLRYAFTARWNIVARAMAVLEAGFVKKMNTDGWRVIIAGGAGRTDYNGGSPLVYDSAAVIGQFTKRLISLMKTTMTRLGGGNTASGNRSTLTDVFISPEALEDIREWDADQVDDVTRREIFTASDGGGPMAQIYGVNLHTLDELGVGQEFQTFFATLGVNMGTDDEEIVVGLDMNKNDSFVMPVRRPLTIFDDENLHRRQRAGFYGWAEHGFASLDGRRCLLASF